MKKVQLSGFKKFEIVDCPKPVIKNSDDVLIKVSAVGLCGSDIHYYLHEKIGDQIIDYPFTIGHEFSGIVYETGIGVLNIKPGDRLAVDPAVSCGACDQCLIGRENTCRELRFIGAPGQLEGAMSEFIIVPEKNCFPVDGFSMAELVFIEPLSIGVYSLKLLTAAKLSSIAILGIGPIGLSLFLAAKKAGISNIFVTDKIDDRLNIGRDLGAAGYWNPDQVDIVKNINQQVHLQMDAVFECCGDQEALDQAVRILKPGGKLVLVGIPENNRINFDINELRRKEIVIQNVRRQNGCMEEAIKLLGTNKKTIKSFITHQFRIEETQKAFDLVANYHDGVIKAIIRFND